MYKELHKSDTNVKCTTLHNFSAVSNVFIQVLKTYEDTARTYKLHLERLFVSTLEFIPAHVVRQKASYQVPQWGLFELARSKAM